MVEVEVFRVGTEVRIGQTIPGIVTGIMIRDGCRISYEISWWDNRTHNCKWLEDCEVKAHCPTSGVVQAIGFRVCPAAQPNGYKNPAPID